MNLTAEAHVRPDDDIVNQSYRRRQRYITEYVQTDDEPDKHRCKSEQS